MLLQNDIKMSYLLAHLPLTFLTKLSLMMLSPRPDPVVSLVTLVTVSTMVSPPSPFLVVVLVTFLIFLTPGTAADILTIWFLSPEDVESDCAVLSLLCLNPVQLHQAGQPPAARQLDTWSLLAEPRGPRLAPPWTTGWKVLIVFYYKI